MVWLTWKWWWQCTRCAPWYDYYDNDDDHVNDVLHGMIIMTVMMCSTVRWKKLWLWWRTHPWYALGMIILTVILPMFVMFSKVWWLWWWPCPWCVPWYDYYHCDNGHVHDVLNGMVVMNVTMVMSMMRSIVGILQYECDNGQPHCSLSRWRPQKVDKRMVLEYTHGLFIT